MTFYATRLSASVLRQVIRHVTQQRASRAEAARADEVGHEVNLRDLSGQKEKVDLDSQEDLRALREELLRYQVDYSVLHDTETGKYEVWFASRDIGQVHAGLERVVKDFDRNAGRTPMAERFEAAKEEAVKRNTERAAEGVEQVVKEAAKEVTL